MKRFTMFACLALALVFAASSFAGELPRFVKSGGNEVLTGAGQTLAKASRDTVVLIGPNSDTSAQVIGTFEDAVGNASWNGWTHIDLTQKTVPHWQASTYFAVNGTYSAWCGEDVPSCGGGDPAGGYVNGYNELLEWRGAVTDNSLSCTVTVTATVQHNTEPNYDWTFLSYETYDGGIIDVGSYTGEGVENVNQTFSYGPADYMGTGADEVVVLFRVTSDGGWSDSDCSYPSNGACQVDDVNITLSNGPGYSTDFEDGTLGDFTVRFPIGVGDFAKIWTGLEDADPCHSNYTAQVAFIDDGVVVPGTGGTPCVDWCYGPAGFIVNTTGGLAGPANHLWDAIESPVINWGDQTNNGCSFLFDAYRHEDLSEFAPGIFYTWGIRSAAPGDDIFTAGWNDRNFVYYGDPTYIRGGDNVAGDLLVAGRDRVQVQLTAYELGYIWGYTGNNGYPAPYFDNVRLITYPIIGPAMATREIDQATDNFPEIGVVDLANLGVNSVRFDMAQNISDPSHLRNDPGDSVVFDAVVVRQGAAMTGNPRMYYKLFANPVFDAYRTSGLPNEGYVLCDSVRSAAGYVVPDRWYADLPDTGFFFPGDIIHYFFQASDDLGGAVETATLPADTTGFSIVDPHNALTYNSSFTIRALPTINGSLEQPPVLFWNDFANRGGQAEWHGAFNNLGLLAGRDYDVFYTKGPSSGVGDGLGGRATDQSLVGYSDMLYTAGDLSKYTISNGDYNNDAGPDADVLDLWLRQGGKDFFGTGDSFASEMAVAGANTAAFLSDQLGLSIDDFDVRPLIDSQAAPRVLPMSGNPVFNTVNSWIAYGGCNGINTFDAVEPLPGATRIAEFANKAGNGGAYPYSAATLNAPAWGARVITLPYDLMFVYTDPNEPTAKAEAALSARVRLLEDVLLYFGQTRNPGDQSDVVPTRPLAQSAAPNPFNPTTTIKFYAPKAGHMTMKIFNVRGELVKTLIDAQVAMGAGQQEWDGTNNNGSSVPSGVYFAQTRLGSDTVVSKMALVK